MCVCVYLAHHKSLLPKWRLSTMDQFSLHPMHPRCPPNEQCYPSFESVCVRLCLQRSTQANVTVNSASITAANLITQVHCCSLLFLFSLHLLFCPKRHWNHPQEDPSHNTSQPHYFTHKRFHYGSFAGSARCCWCTSCHTRVYTSIS